PRRCGGRSVANRLRRRPLNRWRKMRPPPTVLSESSSCPGARASTVGGSREGSMQRHLRKLLVVVVVPAPVAPALASSAGASVFENAARGPTSDPRPGGGRGYAVIPICIIEGSSVDQWSDDDPSGAYTERWPEITTVIDAIRSALSSMW